MKFKCSIPEQYHIIWLKMISYFALESGEDILFGPESHSVF